MQLLVIAPPLVHESAKHILIKKTTCLYVQLIKQKNFDTNIINLLNFLKHVLLFSFVNLHKKNTCIFSLISFQFLHLSYLKIS